MSKYPCAIYLLYKSLNLRINAFPHFHILKLSRIFLFQHYLYYMQMEWLKTGIGPLKDLIAFLQKQSTTNDVHKKQVIRELQNNLNVFKNGFLNNASYNVMIDLLSNEAIKQAITANFAFKKLKSRTIEPYHIYDDRNKRYLGWTAEKLTDKIDEKIEELKTIKKMNNGSVENVKNNLSLMISNLYYRMKLLADFIRGEK